MSYFNFGCESKACCKKDCECSKCCPTSSCCGPSPCCAPCCPEMNDCLAKQIECLWKQAFCTAIIIPGIGIPSCSCGVLTLTHNLGPGAPPVKINGLPSLSILANNAIYTAEVSCGKWLNLYMITIPDIPGKNGCKSSGEVYTDALAKSCISINGKNYRWDGACPRMINVNSSAIGMDPIEFTKKQLCALQLMADKFKCQ